MLCINALQFLPVDAMEQAHSAHPELAVGRTALAKYRRVSASITSLMLVPLDSAVHAGRVPSLLTCSDAAQGEQL